MKIFRLMILALILFFPNGCAINPVTQNRELVLVSESMEMGIGQKQYAPSRQMQGGDYILDPELNRYVSEVGNRIVAVSDRKLPYEFAILNNGTPNAWALPGGKIAINRGLLVELQNEAELAAVLAHEIVHAAARHGAKSAERHLILQGLVAIVAIAAGSSDFSALAVGSAVVGASLIKQTYSREDELEADHYSMLYMVRAGYDPKAAVDLQEKFVKLSKEKKSNWLDGLFASHPPSEERVDKNRERLINLSFGDGETGSERYREKTAFLLKVRPAYALYEKGVKAIHQSRPAEAFSSAKEAIRMEPREALFYCLFGESLFLQGDQGGALNAYNSAVEKDPNYFRYYLKRGQLYEAMKNEIFARKDLQQSLELFPTADAHLSLGRMFAAEGDVQKAIDNFEKAAGSRSAAGQEAKGMLHRLDLPKNPDRYLTSYLEEKDGRIHVFINNPTTVAVSNLTVVLSKGWKEKDKVRMQVQQEIAPNGYYRVATAIKVSDKKEMRQWWVRIEKAMIR